MPVMVVPYSIYKYFMHLQNSQSPESQGEKKFTMNPNAGVFQSQIYSASQSQSQTGDDEAQQNEQSDFQGM